MKKVCKHCGEELFGVVNRCWSCGIEIEVVNLSTIPPIRRAPVDLAGKRIGHIVDPDAVKQFVLLPFAKGISEKTGHQFAMASALIGGVGCLFSIVTGWTFMFGIVGIIVGMIGMQAKRTDLATMGLVLSVIALFIGFGQIGFDLWTKYQTQQWLQELGGFR